MAIYHAHFNNLSRSNNASAVSAAAYGLREKLYDSRQGKWWNYQNREQPLASGLLFPECVPERFQSNEVWDRLEQFEDAYAYAHYKTEQTQQKHIETAQVAQRLEFSLPRELTLTAWVELSKEFATTWYVKLGLPVAWAIHGDEGNPHVHFLISRRAMDENGQFSKAKNRFITSRTGFLEARRLIADLINHYLAREGFETRVDHRSFAERGIAFEPTQHEGYLVQSTSDEMSLPRLREENKAIRARNREQAALNPDLILQELTQYQATFRESDVAYLVQKRVGDDIELMQQVHETIMNTVILVGRRVDGVLRYTTPAYYQKEAATLEHLSALLTQAPVQNIQPERIEALFASEAYQHLSQEQRQAVHALCQSSFSVMVGRAGTGKTTTLKAIVELYRQAHFSVMGMSLSAVASEKLGLETQCEAETIAFYLHQWQRLDALRERMWQIHDSEAQRQIEREYQRLQPYELTDKHVVLVDEAGMAGTESWYALLSRVQRSGATLIAVGDDHQFKSIEAGDVFRKMVEESRVHQRLSGLSTIYRQKDAWMKTASHALSELRVFDALAAYENKGCLNALPSGELGEVARAYFEKRRLNPEKTGLLLASTRAQCQALNDAIRAQFKAIGGLRGKEYHFNGRAFTVGDEIVFLKNDRDQRIRTVRAETGEAVDFFVKNGTRGKIRAIEAVQLGFAPNTKAGPLVDVRLTVQLTHAIHAEFTLKDYGGIDHGYAISSEGEYQQFEHSYSVTAHKAQGQTVDWVFAVLSRRMDAYALYVTLTRHRESVTLYYDAKEFSSFKALQHHFSRTVPKDLVVDYSIESEHYPAWQTVQRYLESTRELMSVLAECARKRSASDGQADDTLEPRDQARIKALTLARKTEGTTILNHWTTHRRYAEQGGLTVEALLIVCGEKARPLSRAEQAAQARVFLYIEKSRVVRALYHQIRHTHGGWRFKTHPSYATYAKHRAVRDKIAREIVEQAPLHREFVHQAFTQGVHWKILHRQARQSRPQLPSPEMRAAVDTYVARLQAFHHLWTTLQSSAQKEGGMSQRLVELSRQLTHHAQTLLKNKRVYHSFVQAHASSISWTSIAAMAHPMGEDPDAPQRVVAYQKRVRLAREAWKALLASDADFDAFQAQYATFVRIQTERNRLARFLVERAESHQPWVLATRTGAVPITWSLIERHVQQVRSPDGPTTLGAHARHRLEASLQAPLSPLMLTLGLQATLEALVEHLLGSPHYKTATTWVYGRENQIRVTIAGTRKGQIIDQSRGIRGGPIELIASVLEGSRAKALEWAHTWLNTPRQATLAKSQSKAALSRQKADDRVFIPADRVGRELQHHSERLVLQLLGTPTQVRGDQWRWGRKGSVVVYVQGEKQGLYSDFEQGVHGNLLTLIQDRQGLSSKKEAFQWGLSFLGYHPFDPEFDQSRFVIRAPEVSDRQTPVRLRPEWVPIYPIPEDAPVPNLADNPFLNRALLSAGLQEVARYAYRDADGQLVGYVVRLEDEHGQKSVRPLTYCENKSGKQYWRWKGFGDQRPVYGLPELAKAPERPVLLVEGEKTAEVARALFKEHTVVSWHGGTGAVRKVDWTPLMGKEVVLWPDHDVPGQKAMEWIQAHLRELNQQSGHEVAIRCVSVPQDWPEKWDLADPIPKGWRLEDLHTFVQKAEERGRDGEGGLFSGLFPLAASKKEIEVIIQATLHAYKLEKPKAMTEEITLKQIHARYQTIIGWLPKKERAELSWREEFSFKQKAILAEVVKPHLKADWIVNSPLEAHHRTEQIALITVDLIRSHSDKRHALSELVEIGSKLYNSAERQKDQDVALYRKQYPALSNYQLHVLADQQILHRNAVGREFTEAQRHQVLDHARLVEAHQHIIHRESQQMLQSHAATRFNKETMSTVSLAIERHAMDLYREQENQKSHATTQRIHAMADHIHRAVAETHQLQAHLEIQRTMHAQSRALMHEHDRGGDRDR